MNKDKWIYCGLWGDIKVTPLFQMFIDTPEFQRMRFMKQLGTSYYVYPSAESSRFSHSLGVGNLARLVSEHLKKLYPDLVTDRDIELLTIAGLTHDIGHGPLSHTFDWMLQSSECLLKIHEERSRHILRFMIKKYHIPLTEDEIQFICDCYDPPEKFSCIWKYQIISSTVDVDRLDYILRDSKTTSIPVKINENQVRKLIRFMRIKNNKLVFQPRAINIIYDLLDSRKHMFERVYQHKVSISIDHMLKKVFKGVKHIPEYNLEFLVKNIKEFVKIDDSIIQKIYYDNRTPSEIKQIIYNIFTRKFDYNKMDYKYEKIKINVDFTENINKSILDNF